MTLNEFVDIATRLSGVVALLIIAIPKLTELVIGRYLTGSLERQKQELQLEVERLKGELSKSVETHKANLQQTQIEEHRRYVETVDRRKDVSQHHIDNLNLLLANIRRTLAELSDSSEYAYKQVKALLDFALTLNATTSCICQQYIKTVDEECERPGALVDPNFIECMRHILISFAAAIEKELTNIKGGAK